MFGSLSFFLSGAWVKVKINKCALFISITVKIVTQIEFIEVTHGIVHVL